MTRTESQINYWKDYLLRKDLLVSENTDAHISINAKMDFLREEAKETMDRDARSSLNSLVRQNLLEKSLLSGDGLLYFEVIEEPFIHENPRVTSPSFVFIAFVFISWAGSVLITYLRRYIV